MIIDNSNNCTVSDDLIENQMFIRATCTGASRLSCYKYDTSGGESYFNILMDTVAFDFARDSHSSITNLSQDDLDEIISVLQSIRDGEGK